MNTSVQESPPVELSDAAKERIEAAILRIIENAAGAINSLVGVATNDMAAEITRQSMSKDTEWVKENQ